MFRLTKTARFLEKPIGMNLELTKKCPLNCPQCYVANLNDNREISLDVAKKYLHEAAEIGIHQINLSGGETLAYSHLEEIIKECKQLGLESAIALSGAYVTKSKLESVISAGVTEIFVSLNGSSEEVNRQTRDGYQLAIKTFELLKELKFEEIYINWVMHESNAEDFANLVDLAEKFGVKTVVVLGFKPDSKNQLDDYPTSEQILTIARFIKSRNESDKPSILVEPCFSQLRAVIGHGFILNFNRGINRGCGAGRDSISIDIDGNLTPCRHLNLPENFSSIMEYWTRSEILKKLRTLKDDEINPHCSACKYLSGCLPCAAINWQIHGTLKFGMLECPLS